MENKKTGITKYVIAGISILLISIMICALFVINTYAYEGADGYVVYNASDFRRTNITSDYVEFTADWIGGGTGKQSCYIIYKTPEKTSAPYGRIVIEFDATFGSYTLTSAYGNYDYQVIKGTVKVSDDTTIKVRYWNEHQNQMLNGFELFELVITNGSNDNALAYVEGQVASLNRVSTDFVTKFESYTTGYVTNTIDKTSFNTGVTYSENIYLTKNTEGVLLTINGSVAMNDGVSQYTAYVTGDVDFQPIALKSLTTTDDSTWANNYILANSLTIKNYGNQSKFSATFDLSNREGDSLAIYITAENPHNQVETVILCLLVHVNHTPGVTPPDEPDSPTESDTDNPDIPIEPPDYNTPELQEAFNKGYQEAITQMQNGIFGDIRVKCKYYYYSVELNDQLTDEVVISLSDFKRGVSFKQLYTYYVNSEYYNDNFVLSFIWVDIEFPAGFRFNNNLLYFTGNDTLTISDMPTNILIYTIDGGEENHAVTLTKKFNNFYWNVVNTDEYLRVDALSFRIDDLQKSFYDLLVTDNLTLASNTIQYTTDIASWQDGKNVGYKEGYDDAFDKGIEIGKEEGNVQFYNDGYDKGYSDGELLGYVNGKSDGLKEQFNWYEIPISIFDALSGTFRDMFTFEVFGVNISAFLLSILTTLIAIFIIKKVL